jgi:hypothetical protein
MSDKSTGNLDENLLFRLQRHLVIAVLSLLASAATASAECAWALWVWEQRSGKWDIEGVWEDHEACLQQLGVHKASSGKYR